jgi:hypothetical protein
LIIKSEYDKLNNSFKKKLIFHVGIEAGFFSEYNNMVLAMLYCLDQKIAFSLYSQDANFKVKNGWTDYFLPFCEEVTDINHSIYNYRMPLQGKIDKGSFLSLLPQKIKRAYYFRNSPRFDFFTYDLWNKFRSSEMKLKYFTIPKLNVEGDLQSLCSMLINLTWQYNALTKKRVDDLIRSANLPKDYIGIHIRQGDKVKEFKAFDYAEYIIRAESLTEIRKAFVLTDDYTIINHLRMRFSKWEFFTLCTEDEKGYSHDEFSKKSIEFKDSKLVKLFSAIDILNKSKFFIGTFSSNPGMYLGMRRPRETTIGLDFNSWIIL